MVTELNRHFGLLQLQIGLSSAGVPRHLNFPNTRHGLYLHIVKSKKEDANQASNAKVIAAKTSFFHVWVRASALAATSMKEFI